MCAKFPKQEKAQSCPGLLPDDFVYFFEEEYENPGRRGLFMMAQSKLYEPRYKTKRYTSFEKLAKYAAVKFNNFDAKAFYEMVGLKDVANDESPKKMPAKISTTTVSNVGRLTPRKLAENKCGDCDNCKREPCGQCDTCRNDTAACCLRRVRQLMVKCEL